MPGVATEPRSIAKRSPGRETDRVSGPAIRLVRCGLVRLVDSRTEDGARPPSGFRTEDVDFRPHGMPLIVRILDEPCRKCFSSQGCQDLYPLAPYLLEGGYQRRMGHEGDFE